MSTPNIVLFIMDQLSAKWFEAASAGASPSDLMASVWPLVWTSAGPHGQPLVAFRPPERRDRRWGSAAYIV